jgi:predicted DNA-binding transcriptional regulator AlpA
MNLKRFDELKKSKPIDSMPRFITWLNRQFDSVQSGNIGDADHSAMLGTARLVALRLGAGDLIGPVTGDSTRIVTLAALGRLMAWCRSQPDGELLWDSDRAANKLGLSARSLWSLTKSGDVPSMKIGRLVRYSPTALRDWIAATHASAT